MNITATWSIQGDCYGGEEVVFMLWVDDELVLVDRPCVREF